MNLIEVGKGIPTCNLNCILTNHFQGIILRIYLSWWFHLGVGNKISQIEKLNFDANMLINRIMNIRLEFWIKKGCFVIILD